MFMQVSQILEEIGISGFFSEFVITNSLTRNYDFRKLIFQILIFYLKF